MRVSLPIVTAAFCVLCSLAYGEDLNRVRRGPGVTVRYGEGAALWAQRTIALFPAANKHALETLGITTNRVVTIHLYATTRGFRQATNYTPSDTLGIAYPHRSAIVIDCAKATVRGPNSFGLTLRHEIIHIAFGRLAARTGLPVPLWFNEGVACWGMGRLRGGDPSQLVRAANTDSLFPLDHLAYSFPREGILLELAYQQSESAVEFLVTRYGEDSLRRIVARMGEGITFDQALAEVTGGANFEADWRRYVSRKYPLLALFSNLFSLFSLLAFFVIFAYLVYRLRRRRIRQRWQEEEEYQDGGSGEW